MYFQIWYNHTTGKWHWRLRGPFKEVLAQGADYADRAEAEHAIRQVKTVGAHTPVRLL